MKFWNEEKSIRLSRVIVMIFALAILAVDVCAALLCLGKMPLLGTLLEKPGQIAAFALCTYACSVPGYLLLWDMNRLLKNLQQQKVFIPENVSFLRTVSYCCFAASAVCFGCAVKIPALLSVTVAAGFVGLIVRIVKNVIQQAIRMKDELDLTV